MHPLRVSFSEAACHSDQEFVGQSGHVVEKAGEFALPENDNFQFSGSGDSGIARRAVQQGQFAEVVTDSK